MEQAGGTQLVAEPPPPPQTTAFRAAEKFYQLHKPQGRQRRGRVAAYLDVDLSSVLDLQCTKQMDYWLSEGLIHKHTVPSICINTDHLTASIVTDITQCSLNQQPGLPEPDGPPIPAYTLPGHPGLLVVPGALGPAQQLDVAQAAFLHYPEPPARTNHDREYGPLTGVWAAAQQGLLLKVPKRVHAPGVDVNTQPYPHYATESEPANTKQRPAQQATQAPGDAVMPSPAQSNTSDTTQVLDASDPALNTSADRLEPAERPATPDSNYSMSSSSQAELEPGPGTQQHSWHQPSFDDCWMHPASSSCHNATKAASMLKRMRWAVLGPHYDWTRRLYVRNEPHRRLPVALAAMASHWGRTAQHLATQHNTCAGTCEHQPQCPHAARDVSRAAQRQYTPDGALVNFYYEGDTLMGHCDDVEADLSQPIVALSLGCDAVFLMGGATKSTPPTPLLVRSGDIVVLAGAARRSYHGVPRVLTHHPLPAGLSQYVSNLDPETQQRVQPFLQHLTTCRINISVRAVC